MKTQDKCMQWGAKAGFGAFALLVSGWAAALPPHPPVIVPAPVPVVRPHGVHPHGVRPVVPARVYVPAAPPLRREVVPVVPYPGAVWMPGRWVWRGGRHVWVRGYYARPRGYVRPHHPGYYGPRGHRPHRH